MSFNKKPFYLKKKKTNPNLIKTLKCEKASRSNCGEGREKEPFGVAHGLYIVRPTPQIKTHPF